jgi:hypothetical protein
MQELLEIVQWTIKTVGTEMDIMSIIKENWEI